MSVSASGFTMTVGGTTYTVAVSPSTVYLLAPKWSTTLSTLAPGDRVSVRGTVSGTHITATAVQAQIWGITAKVTALNGETAVVSQPSGRTATLRFSSTPKLSVGQTVQAVGTWQGDTLTVRAWRVAPSGGPAPGPRPGGAPAGWGPPVPR